MLFRSIGQGHLLLSEYLGKSLRFNSVKEKFNKDPLVLEYQEFTRDNHEIIRSQPHMIPQVMMNEPEDSNIRLGALQPLNHINNDIVYLQQENRPKTKAEKSKDGKVISKNAKNPTTFFLHLKDILVSGFANGSILAQDSNSLEIGRAHV